MIYRISLWLPVTTLCLCLVAPICWAGTDELMDGLGRIADTFKQIR